jgi:cytochrome oxidase Cu insertion factor (SCO1/SenC/PrrC family)
MIKSSFYFRGPALRLLLLAVLFLLAIIATIARAHDEEKLPRSVDHDYDAPLPGTYKLPVIKAAADAALVDPAGKPVSLRELTRGRVTILSFIYTRCASAKACPMATGVLMDLHELSGANAELARNLRLVSMSFDPVHDTPERMRAYSELASERLTGAPWHFVTARSETELQPVLAAYGQAVDRKSNPADPTGPLNHTLRVYLIDRPGRIRNIYSSGTLDVRLVLADVRTLLLEKKAP